MLHERLWPGESHMDFGSVRTRGKNPLFPSMKNFKNLKKEQQECLNCGKTWRLPVKNRFDTHLKTL
ncbi:hypothetical protein SB48_HM08orf06127 [Heyndrickxia coagulans]|jgi:hypothetical protein|uniref:Uncharacterized protein n=1 Tax=Heyndrickxia coagulans TaxID=1398 RepID=A0AAN0TAH3_HEYCO|nr:hypothetical protein SB48_HM08orf06127 [Heyndrickxia coagulans]